MDRYALGKRLTDARQAAGYTSLRRVERAVWQILGGHSPSLETIRQYHNGNAPAHPDLELLLALARIYQCDPVEFVGPERMEQVRDLLIRVSGWIHAA